MNTGQFTLHDNEIRLMSKTSSKSEAEGGKGSGDVVLSGSMTRQVCPHHSNGKKEKADVKAEVDYPLTNTAGHIPNIGRMVEDME